MIWQQADHRMMCYVANGKVLVKMEDWAVMGDGWLSSVAFTQQPREYLDVSVDSICNSAGQRLRMPSLINPTMDMDLTVRYEPGGSMIQDEQMDSFGSILTESLSEFDLMKEINKRWRKEDEGKQD